MASWLMLICALVIRVFGSVQNNHTKTLIFVGVTALFGGVWGIGTVIIILAGIVMLSVGFKQVSVIKEQVSLKELRQIRRERLEGIEDEEGLSKQENKTEGKKPSVSEEILEGFIGSEDHRREIQTWIDENEFDRLELTPEEVKAKAKQEIRDNNLSLETILALEELEGTPSTTREADLTNVNLDMLTSDEETESERYLGDYIEDSTDDEIDESEYFKGMSIEDLLDD